MADADTAPTTTKTSPVEIMRFRGTRYYDTWFHTGDLVYEPYEGTTTKPLVFDKKARSVIQDDCHVHGILHHGYKVGIQQYSRVAEVGGDADMIKVLKAESEKRLRQLYDRLKLSSDPEFDLANLDPIRRLVSRVWSDEFERVD